MYVEDKENYSGKNRVQIVWEWKSEDQNLEMARGVRYIEFMDKKAYRKAQCRVANKNLYKLLEENYKITIIISGTDESGRKFYGVKRYGMDNCAVGYKFLSIQRTWFSKELSLDAKDLKGIPIKRFQNFDKLYKPGMKDGVNVDEVIYPKNPDEKDIVDKKKAKKVTLTDFISAFFAESLSSQRRKNR